jgi:hypothetical protein
LQCSTRCKCSQQRCFGWCERFGGGFQSQGAPAAFHQARVHERIQPSTPPLAVNRFIADQSALQLRILGRADAEKHRRYRINVERADASSDGLEHLDWVTVGQLVTIPQPDADQHFNRPHKFALLRRGPYVVTEVRPRTVSLRDHLKLAAGANPPVFPWPKSTLALYHAAADILPALPDIPDVPVDDDEELPVANTPRLPSAILSDKLTNFVIPNAPRHVRNHEYMVRWAGLPHSANCMTPYDRVWASPAFSDFVQGSELTGHVPPQQFQAEHVRHVSALASGNANPPRAVPLADPDAQGRLMHDFVPFSDARRPRSGAVQVSAQLPPLQLAQELSQFPAEVPAPQQAPLSPAAAQVSHGPVVSQRPVRELRPKSFGEDFTH